MLSAIWQAKVQVQEGILFLVILLSLWRGASPEKIVAVLFAFMILGDRLYHAMLTAGMFWHRIDLGHLVIDLVALVALVMLAMKANRMYPMILAALQLVTTIAHVVIGINRSLVTGIYSILAIAPSYLMILVFAAGLFLHLRREAKFGPYCSWSNF